MCSDKPLCAFVQQTFADHILLHRTLSLMDAEMEFLSVAPNDLQCLRYNLDILQETPEGSYIDSAVARLTNLTTLELRDCGLLQDHRILRKMALRELSLRNCRIPQLSTVFVPGFLTALEKLHIEDKGVSNNGVIYLGQERAGNADSRLEPAAELRKVGATILALPNLRQLSGWSLLLDEMAEDLKKWRATRDLDLLHSGIYGHTLPYWSPAWVKGWRKL